MNLTNLINNIFPKIDPFADTWFKLSSLNIAKKEKKCAEFGKKNVRIASFSVECGEKENNSPFKIVNLTKLRC